MNLMNVKAVSCAATSLHAVDIFPAVALFHSGFGLSLTACDGAQGPQLRVQMWKPLCVCLTAWLHVKVSPPYKPPREGYISFICEEDYSVLEPIIHSRF